MFRKKDDEPIPPLPSRGAMPAPPAPPAAKSPPPPARAAAAPAEPVGKRLIVGQGLSLSGDITSCDLLVVEGNVQVTLNDTRAIEIAESGRFTNSKASVEDAVISGVYEAS
ncbi:MAG: polymer-forming cytoskeletal protein [Geminicoccaceae bacterium]